MHMQIQSLRKLVIAVVMTSQLSACGVLAVGGVAAGASVMADRRTPGVQAIDNGIELEANAALGKKFGDNAHINVTSFNQKVLLTGEVKDAGIKSEAGAYVKAMKNARSVFNELIIGSKITYYKNRISRNTSQYVLISIYFSNASGVSFNIESNIIFVGT